MGEGLNWAIEKHYVATQEKGPDGEPFIPGTFYYDNEKGWYLLEEAEYSDGTKEFVKNFDE